MNHPTSVEVRNVSAALVNAAQDLDQMIALPGIACDHARGLF